MENEFDFAAHEARMRRLQELLSVAPIVEVAGVVDATGPGAGRSPDETLWTMLLSLEVWRIGSGEPQLRRLTARCAMTQEELDKWRDKFRPYAVVRLRARIVDDPEFVRPDALIEEIVSCEFADPTLEELAARLQAPVTYEDPEFGTLTLDRRIDVYAGAATWNGSPVRIDIATEPDGRIPAQGIATLRALWQDQSGWADRITSYTIAELLPLKNGNWLQDGEGPLSEADFARRMKLETISVRGDTFTFWHADGDMFWGHVIDVHGTLADGPITAGIAG